ncbi:hypothetical protein SRABI128_06228 [Microbacterium sp. Bi128]|nr:hypothetical protein SRABI128_06228 [Microbacterium sp. Bi128]
MARDSGQHVLGECDVGRGDAIKESVVEHAAGAVAGFLGGLEQGHERASPLVLVLGEQSGGAQQACDVNVMSAGVHDGHTVPALVQGCDGACVVCAGPFLQGQRVHVGPE